MVGFEPASLGMVRARISSVRGTWDLMKCRILGPTQTY